jgi:hypothetical protein
MQLPWIQFVSPSMTPAPPILSLAATDAGSAATETLDDGLEFVKRPQEGRVIDKHGRDDVDRYRNHDLRKKKCLSLK